MTRQTLAAATLAAFAVPFGATMLPGVAAAADVCPANGPIKFADLPWESGAFITSVISTLFSDGYGCEVDTVVGNSVVLSHAVVTDDVQIFAEQWVGRTEVFDAAVAEGKAVNVGHPFVGATEGWFVPAYMIEGDEERGVEAVAPGLKSVDDLHDPAVAQLFSDPEEPSKGAS